jgi:hypothetical protein
VTVARPCRVCGGPVPAGVRDCDTCKATYARLAALHQPPVDADRTGRADMERRDRAVRVRVYAVLAAAGQPLFE